MPHVGRELLVARQHQFPRLPAAERSAGESEDHVARLPAAPQDGEALIGEDEMVGQISRRSLRSHAGIVPEEIPAGRIRAGWRRLRLVAHVAGTSPRVRSRMSTCSSRAASHCARPSRNSPASFRRTWLDAHPMTLYRPLGSES